MTASDADPAGRELGSWLHQLAQPIPNPGGGAAAAVVLAQAAALTEMVCGYTTRSTTSATHRAVATTVRTQALELAAADGAASEALAVAFRLPAGDAGAARAQHDALVRAARTSGQICMAATPLLSALAWLAGDGAPALRSDVVVAAHLAAAAVRSAAATLRVNRGGAPEAERTRELDAAAVLAAALDEVAAGVATEL